MPPHHLNGPTAIGRRLMRNLGRRWAQRAGGSRLEGQAGPLVPSWAVGRPRTTAEATIRPERMTGYTRLVWAPGEDHMVRHDLGSKPDPDRSTRRRSVLYFAHHTDAHVCDAQSTSRLESGKRFGWFDPGADGAHRPQETCTTQVLDQMVRATNAVTASPITGAPLAWCMQTGDNTDNRTVAETRWFVDVLGGRSVTPDTGRPGRYEGVQRSGARWSFQPDDPSGDGYGRAGFPTLPGFLDAAVRTFEPAGLDVPWLAVMGNHDAVFLGTFGPMRGLRFDRYAQLLVGAARKPIGVVSMLAALAHATFIGTDPARWNRRRHTGLTLEVALDPQERAAVGLDDYLAAMIDDPPRSARSHDRDPTDGSGHGFDEANRRGGATAWWSRPEGERVQLIGLDTCNHTNGSEGALADAQFRWLEDELVRHHSRWRDAYGSWRQGDGIDRICVIFSHHTSWSMSNKGPDVHFPGPRHLGPEVVALLHRFPNVVLWVNGHTHRHQIDAHRNPWADAHERDGAGFWEVNTASCIDFGQQARTIELVDNRDGTLSIFTTVLDHAAPPSVAIPGDGRWEPVELASMSRELAANDAVWVDPQALLGRRIDRNTELLIRDPQSMSGNTKL